LLYYSVANPGPGKIGLRLWHTKKGVYQYRVSVNTDFNQDSWTYEPITQIITVTVKPGPIDDVRFVSDDISSYPGGMFFPSTVDYNQTFTLALYDFYNNSIEEYKGKDIKAELQLQMLSEPYSTSTGSWINIFNERWEEANQELRYTVQFGARKPGW